MTLFPGKSEILILPFPRNQIQRRLHRELTLEKSDPSQKFIGWLRGDKFKISQRLTKPDNYVPLISGTIDCSSKDCIIFLKYRLMYSTKMFLFFWSVTLLLLCIFFITIYQENLYGFVSLGLGVINYLVVYINFKKQVKISHSLFLKMMEEPFE